MAWQNLTIDVQRSETGKSQPLASITRDLVMFENVHKMGSAVLAEDLSDSGWPKRSPRAGSAHGDYGALRFWEVDFLKIHCGHQRAAVVARTRLMHNIVVLH